jgi:hypothetical protein
MRMLDDVRAPLLTEALRSPALLSDLAGLERYIAESYDARSFVELLQNADDAGSKRMTIERSGNVLVVANDGHCFTREEFESLCRSAASPKHRGTSIGYRGIGFKSVVGLAEVVHVLSGPLEATFSRARTMRDIPEATRVPLIRIPHPLTRQDRGAFDDAVGRLFAKGFTTVFVFDGLVANAIEAEFASFDPTSLLFLRNVCSVTITGATTAVIAADREACSCDVRSLRLTSPDGTSVWSLIAQDEIDFAFICDEHGVVPMKADEAVVHAFLPTHETTGFPFKLNGDISTDPSRTRLVLDDRTAEGTAKAASFFVRLLEDVLSGAADPQLMPALMPLIDPRLASLQRRSFRSDLYSAVRKAAHGRFDDVWCRPPWLNAGDYVRLAAAAGIRYVPRKFDTVEGLPELLKFFGSKEATFRNISAGLEDTVPSVTGAAELVSHLTHQFSTRQIEPKTIHRRWKMWPTDKAVLSLEDLELQSKPLNESFVDAVGEKCGTASALRRFVGALTDEGTADKLLPQARAVVLHEVPTKHTGRVNTQISVKRWRGAEQQVIAVLTAWGWKVEDVSRQNIGFDIEGQTPDGKEVFIEVKTIGDVGGTFTLTSNEEAVARQKGKQYKLALVRHASEYLEVAFIEDPIANLKLTRQCRQWVWECSGYEFRPERFRLE